MITCCSTTLYLLFSFLRLSFHQRFYHIGINLLAGASVKQTASLFANADAYQKSLADAKQELDKKVKKAADHPKHDPKDNSNKQVYEEKMKKVAELDAACKYTEALAELPNAADFPEKKSEIEGRKAELDRKSAQLSLL